MPSSLQASIWPCSSASRENNEYSICSEASGCTALPRLSDSDLHGIGHHRHAKFLAGVDLALLFRITREQRILHLQRSERVHGAATPKRFGRALRERDETRLALPDELGHSANAFLDWHIRIDARHAKDVERLDAEILQALFAGLTDITRITAAAHRVWAAIARAATL